MNGRPTLPRPQPTDLNFRGPCRAKAASLISRRFLLVPLVQYIHRLYLFLHLQGYLRRDHC